MAGRDVQSSGLVRVFAVSHGLGAFDGKIQALRKFFKRPDRNMIAIRRKTLQLGGDLSVVSRGAGVGFARESEAGGQTQLAVVVELCRNGGIVGVIRHDAYALEIFRGGANHSRAADVDIFDELRGRNPGRRRRR